MKWWCMNAINRFSLCFLFFKREFNEVKNFKWQYSCMWYNVNKWSLWLECCGLASCESLISSQFTHLEGVWEMCNASVLWRYFVDLLFCVAMLQILINDYFNFLLLKKNTKNVHPANCSLNRKCSHLFFQDGEFIQLAKDLKLFVQKLTIITPQCQ